MSTAENVRDEFRRVFDAASRLFRAPARVNIIGEHTDYNNGFVLPAAIGFAAYAAVAPREDRTVEIYSTHFSERVSCPLDDLNPAPRGHWSNYVAGVAAMLERAGHKLRGVNMVVGGDVPPGAGLSSSAALEVASALAFLAVSEIDLDRTEIARLCQQAEHEFAGARVGIMDQFVSCHGRDGYAILLDCRSLASRLVAVPKHIELVICDTMVRHDLAAGEYNTRRSQCEAGVKALSRFLPGLQSLRDVTLVQLEEFRPSMDPVIYRRCRHVISENDRVLRAASALECGALDDVAELLKRSHLSLRDDYQVSSEELDLMVSLSNELSGEMSGIHGARMTGGGFGGCTINLIERAQARTFAERIAQAWEARAGRPCAVYLCSPAQGAVELA